MLEIKYERRAAKYLRFFARYPKNPILAKRYNLVVHTIGGKHGYGGHPGQAGQPVHLVHHNLWHDSPLDHVVQDRTNFTVIQTLINNNKFLQFPT